MPKKERKSLVVKRGFVVKKELVAKKNTELYNVLAPLVRELAKQISDVKIPNIERITLISADKEILLQQTNNQGTELEVHFSPHLQPKK